MSTIYMEGGPRRGAGLMIEPDIKAQLALGHRVIVQRKGVYFDAVERGDGIAYIALPSKPAADEEAVV